MKFLSKNNNLGRFKDEYEANNRYGFKKLASGLLVSAALGSFFILNTGQVKADSLPTDKTEQVTNSEKLPTQNSATQKQDAQTATPTKTDPITSTNTTQTPGQKADPTVTTSGKTEAGQTPLDDKQKTTTSPTAPINKQPTSKPAAKKPVASEDPEVEAIKNAEDTTVISDEANNATLYVNGDVIGNNKNSKQIAVMLSLAGKKGDVVTLTIPTGYAYTISAPTINDGATITPPSYGSQTNTYTITLTQNNMVITPIFYLNPAANNYSAQPTPMQANLNGEPNIKTISWTYNGKEEESTTFDEYIKPTWNPQTPSCIFPQNVSYIMPNQPVEYNFPINETTGVAPDVGYSSGVINSAVNYGTTIKIPVPEGFKLDEAKTAQANEVYTYGILDTNDKTTITQPGGAGTPIIINVPEGSGAQNYQVGNSGYNIWGSYEIDQPEKDTTLKANGDITITQYIGADHTPANMMTATLPSFSQNIIGQKSTHAVVKLDPEVVNAYNSGYIVENNQEQVVKYFGFKNESTIAFQNDLTITLNIDKNLAVDKIKTPSGTTLPGLTSYTYTMTLKDGTVQKGTVNAGDAVSAGSGEISSIAFVPNYVGVGASTGQGFNGNNLYNPPQNTTTEQFIAFGKVVPGTKAGTVLTSGMALEWNVDGKDEVTTNYVFGKASQIVILPMQEKSGLSYYMYQVNSTGKTGYMSVYQPFNNSITGTEIYEPIFYYVLPKAAAPQNLTLTNLNTNNGVSAQPEVSEFLAGDRIVVKVDYTDTGFYFNTLTNACNHLNIATLPNAINGTYPAEIYVVSPTTKMINTQYEAGVKNFAQGNDTFDPAWVENNLQNLYYVGGGNWNVDYAAGIYSSSSAKGNENLVFKTTGISNSFGSSTMEYGVNINNTNKTDLQDVKLFINLPQASDTSFQFVLNKIENGVSGATYLYSPEVVNFVTSNQVPSTASFVSADQVTDWSQIKSVLIEISTIKGNSSTGTIVLAGSDPTIAQDAGKVGVLATGLYSKNNSPIIINTVADGAASIKVEGEARIEFRYAYTNAQGREEYIYLPNLTTTYSDGQTMMTEQEAIEKLENSSEALSYIPKGYQLKKVGGKVDVKLLPPTSKTWQTDAPIGMVEFGQPVEYYYNNSIVQYQLTPIDATKYMKIEVYYENANPDLPAKLIYTSSSYKGTMGQAITATSPVAEEYHNLENSYEERGFKIDQAKSELPPAYDNIEGQEQVAKIYIENNSFEQGLSIGEKVTYTVEGNPQAEVSPYVTKSPVIFTRKVTKNPQGNSLEFGNWQASVNTTLGAINSPAIIGYKPSVATVASRKITDIADFIKSLPDQIQKELASGQNVDYLIPVQIFYTPLEQEIQVKYYDETAKEYLTSYDKTLSGLSNTSSDYSTKNTLTTLQNIGYQVVSDPTDGKVLIFKAANYQDNKVVPQEYKVIVKEAVVTVTPATIPQPGKPISPDHKDVLTPNDGLRNTDLSAGYWQKIKYVTDKGTALTVNPLPKNQTQTVTYTRDATVNLAKLYQGASDAITYTNWTPNKTKYDAVNNPVIKGYYTTSAQYPAQAVEQKDLTPEVIYYPLGKIVQVDQAGNQIPNTTPVTYNNDPTDPTKAATTPVPVTPRGWKIVKSTNQVTPTSPGQDTKIEYEPIIDHNSDSQTVTRKIVITWPNGQKETITQKVTVSRTITTDEATGQVTESGWSTGSYDKYPVKQITGYISQVDGKDSTEVASASVTFKDGMPQDGQTVQITYTSNATNNDTNSNSQQNSQSNNKHEHSNSIVSPVQPIKIPNKEIKPNKAISKVKAKRFVNKDTRISSPRLAKTQTRAIKPNNQTNETLPQTGSKNSNLLTILGLELSSIFVGLWLTSKRKDR